MGLVLGSTQASVAAAPVDSVTVVSGPQMVLACDQFSGSTLKYAQDHGYCPTVKVGTITPQFVQSYNCGSSYIYIFNRGLRGYAYVDYGFSSSLGIVTSRRIDVAVAAIAAWTDASLMWSTTYDSGRRFAGYTGTGWQSASFSGTVWLVWGGCCTIPLGTDSAYL